MFKKFVLSIFAMCVIFCACKSHGHEEDAAVTSAVNAFANAYFNYDFQGTIPYVTPESVKWLSFAASNIIDEDIALLRAQKEGARHTVENIQYPSDSTAQVACKVYNVLIRDTLGRPGHIVREAIFNLKVVKQNGQWLIRMEGQPRSERQNHG